LPLDAPLSFVIQSFLFLSFSSQTAPKDVASNIWQTDSNDAANNSARPYEMVDTLEALLAPGNAARSFRSFSGAPGAAENEESIYDAVERR
jgi:hypothetical protein